VIVDEDLGDVRQQRLEADDVLQAVGVQAPDQLECLAARAIAEDTLLEAQETRRSSLG
jgi:hypothetical protein